MPTTTVAAAVGSSWSSALPRNPMIRFDCSKAFPISQERDGAGKRSRDRTYAEASLLAKIDAVEHDQVKQRLQDFDLQFALG